MLRFLPLRYISYACYGICLILISSIGDAVFADQAGIPGVATQYKTIHLGQYLKTRPAPRAPAPEAVAIHPPLRRSTTKSEPALAKVTPSSTHLSPIPFAGDPPTLASSFSALGDNGSSIPPDTHGAVGPSHLMVTLNTEIRIQDRNGANIQTVPLNTFWAGFINSRAFDPKVLYDHMAGRWMVTAMGDPAAASSSVLIAVSQTSDPTGVWHIYRIDADAANTAWADYPSIGYNKHWIVVQVNMFSISGSEYKGSQIYAFDKGDLYSAGAGLFTLFNDDDGFAQTPAITFDDTLSTMYLVEQWVPDKDYNHVNKLRISTIVGPVGSESYTPGTAISAITETWDDEAAQTNYAPQAGTTLKIMTNDARLQNTVYRNGALWTIHTIFLPPGSETRSALQWWQLDPNGAILQRGRLDDPTATVFYGYPSIAVNRNNAVLIGYSSFSANRFASANYAFRNGDDPPGTLQSDTILKSGEAKYYKDFGTGRNRWGDYSNTVVDPIDDLSMWTIQQYAATPTGGSDRWGTWWGHLVPPVAAPNLALNPGLFDFAGVEINTTTQENLTVKNTGSALLTISNISHNIQAFDVDRTLATIVPGDSSVFHVSFSSLVTGTFTDTLHLTSDDPEEPVQLIPLQASAIRRADLNGDGNISILDVIILIRHIIGKSTPPEQGTVAFYTADATNDGLLNLLDVVSTVNRLLGRYPKPTAASSDKPGVITLKPVYSDQEGRHELALSVQSGQPLAALQMSISFSQTVGPGIPYLTEQASNMLLMVHQENDRLVMVIYSFDGSEIPAGAYTIAHIPVSTSPDFNRSEVTQLTLVTAADRFARSIPVNIVTSSDLISDGISNFSLEPNRPNPFNPSTSITYDIPVPTHITITIYNLLGQEISTLVDAMHIPGRYHAVWNGKNRQGYAVASGIYLYRLQADTGFSTTKRMTLLR